MASDIRTKICGLSTPETLAAAIEAGAAYVGFVFFEKSPRHVTVDAARDLAVEEARDRHRATVTSPGFDLGLELVVEFEVVVPVVLLFHASSPAPSSASALRSFR